MTGGGVVPARQLDRAIAPARGRPATGEFVSGHWTIWRCDADKPRLWSETELSESSQRNLDILPDGKRFIATMPPSTAEAQTNRNHVVFLENFEDELRRRLEGRN
jgi:hypothetical protein